VDGIEAEARCRLAHMASWTFRSRCSTRVTALLPNAATYPTLNWKGEAGPFAHHHADVGYTHSFPLANGGEIVAGVRSKYSSSYA
jgi:iron complex outermembrane receptor protein